MKNLFTLFLLLIGISGFSQIFTQTNGPASGMNDCKFVLVEGDLLFAGYGSYLIRSDNGGQDWHIVTANFPNIEISPECMIRKDDYLFMGTGTEGRCYRSNNNGRHVGNHQHRLAHIYGIPVLQCSQYGGEWR